MDADGRHQHRLLENELLALQPTWLPDGKQLAFLGIPVRPRRAPRRAVAEPAHALAKAHRKVRNQRKDFQHKAARSLVNRFGTQVFEDLAIRLPSARTSA